MVVRDCTCRGNWRVGVATALVNILTLFNAFGVIAIGVSLHGF
jgi:hypothetical protein